MYGVYQKVVAILKKLSARIPLHPVLLGLLSNCEANYRHLIDGRFEMNDTTNHAIKSKSKWYIADD